MDLPGVIVPRQSIQIRVVQPSLPSCKHLADRLATFMNCRLDHRGRKGGWMQSGRPLPIQSATRHRTTTSHLHLTLRQIPSILSVRQANEIFRRRSELQLSLLFRTLLTNQFDFVGPQPHFFSLDGVSRTSNRIIPSLNRPNAFNCFFPG